MSKKSYIIVRTRFTGIHQWKDAPAEVDFLKAIHRHVFHVEAKIPVTHNDRQLEFFMVQRFLDECGQKLLLDPPAIYIGHVSCEMIADELVDKISKRYGIKRDISVSVFEDNENGGCVEL